MRVSTAPDGAQGRKRDSAEFSLATLQTIYPDAITVSEMFALLDRLAALELLRVHKRESEDVYDFRHAIIRRVTYDQLSFAQRQGLHREIADVIERLHGDRLDFVYAQLAFHREFADQLSLAIGHLDRAADQALKKLRQSERHPVRRKGDATCALCAGRGRPSTTSGLGDHPRRRPSRVAGVRKSVGPL